TEATEINIPGVLRLRVLPGAGERHPFEAKREADNLLRELCERAGVADVGAAREMNQRLRTAEHDSAEAHEVVQLALSGLTAEELEERFTTLTARIQTYQQQRGAEPALPPDIDSAVTAEHIARERLGAVQTQLTACAELRDERRDLAAKLREDAAVREATITAMCAEHEHLQEQLATARDRVGDHLVAEDLAYAEERVTLAERELTSLEETLAALDPEILKIRLDNARQVNDRMIREGEEHDRELNLLTGRLEMAGTEGRQDSLDAAESAAASAESEYRGLHLRAQAAQLLYQTMTEHREEAKRSYVAPFRIKLEQLGRIVFGPDLRLEVDGDLRIVSRTVDGVTIGYENLSTGAQEQLCLISRLACASLVDPAHGVPVIIDDALGHSDPQRLEHLGAVFAASAGSTQIIVLTCVPERFRGIGSAHVIPLTKSTQPARTELDATTATASAPAPDPVAPAGAADLDGATAAITECIGTADHPLRKAEILGRTGLAPESWPQAIRLLLDGGRIVRMGARRGATYQLAR
ncbi:MAG: hypothetical protein ACRDRL_03940, partial [Sciscionella sp.]